MADTPDKEAQENNQPKVLLIAHAKALLASGESLELLPIKHEDDVKSEVSALMESWAKSGFLIHGRFVYPWHQVRSVEITSVEELPQREAHQRLESLYAADRARVQESFWRTRRKGDSGGGKKQG